MCLYLRTMRDKYCNFLLSQLNLLWTHTSFKLKCLTLYDICSDFVSFSASTSCDAVCAHLNSCARLGHATVEPDFSLTAIILWLVMVKCSWLLQESRWRLGDISEVNKSPSRGRSRRSTARTRGSWAASRLVPSSSPSGWLVTSFVSTKAKVYLVSHRRFSSRIEGHRGHHLGASFNLT